MHKMDRFDVRYMKKCYTTELLYKFSRLHGVNCSDFGLLRFDKLDIVVS